MTVGLSVVDSLSRPRWVVLCIFHEATIQGVHVVRPVLRTILRNPYSLSLSLSLPSRRSILSLPPFSTSSLFVFLRLVRRTSSCLFHGRSRFLSRPPFPVLLRAAERCGKNARIHARLCFTLAGSGPAFSCPLERELTRQTFQEWLRLSRFRCFFCDRSPIWSRRTRSRS